MSSAPASKHRIHPIIILTLAGVVFIFAALTASSSPAMASILGVTETPTPISHAQAVLAKPTYTATPIIIPMQVETIFQPVTTDGLMYAQIVPDTPTAEKGSYTAPSGDISAPAYNGNKYILVDISDQYMYVYEGGNLVYSFIVSTGIKNGTRAGTFSVLDKIPNAYGSTWNIWMPNWLGIYYSGGLENGIHALPILPNGSQLWEGYLGTPISYGCVVLGAYESSVLYDWAEIGTPVEIQP